MILIAGTPALVVMAHSPDDNNRANAAFVRFDYRGVDVIISGGEDLDALIAVAKSMIS